jgi:hypothetical protein
MGACSHCKRDPGWPTAESLLAACVAVWGDLVTDTSDLQDIDAASKCAHRGLLTLLAEGITDLQLASPQGSQMTEIQLNGAAKAALRRMQERGEPTSSH